MLYFITLFVYVFAYNQTQAVLQAKLSMITHCNIQQVSAWNCQLCKKISFIYDTQVIQNKATVISGFVGYRKQTQQIIIAWRGTQGNKNWIQDLDFKFVNYNASQCTGCKIHQGFYNAYTSVSPLVKQKVAELFKKYPNSTLKITGHSLGGALALVTALNLNMIYPQKIKQMYIYGCPRIGNGALARYIHSIIPNLYRVIHNKDPVPHLPPIDFQYFHAPYEVLYNEQFSKFEICNESGQDRGCSDRYSPNFNFNDHTFYWVKTDASVC